MNVVWLIIGAIVLAVFLAIAIALVFAALVLFAFLIAGKISLRYNVRNLTLRWKTTLMTALAFTAVIGLLTVMLSFVNGMQKLTNQSGQPGNVLVLADGATDETFSNLSIGDLSEIENLPAVARENGRPLASRETFLVVNQAVADPAGGRPKRRFLQMRGIEDPQLTARVHNLELLPGGQWFSEAGVQGKTSAGEPMVQAVLGEGIARQFARDESSRNLASVKEHGRLDVGDTFVLGNHTWIVVGILKSAGSTFNSEIWAKRSLAASLFGKETYSSLVLRTKDAETAATLKEFLVKDYKKAAVSAQVETEYYKGMSETTAQFSYAIAFLAIVMSVGGIFGVMNTMFAAISQRTGDIGVMRLLGYARWQILGSFLLESVVIALVGGLIGCALGALTHGWTVSSVVSGSGGGKSVVLQLAVDGRIIAIGMLLTLVMGLLGGLLPAWRAMRLKPLEALR
jgi:ABC-type antimicrobial peptide transport system permease subunit